MISDKIPIQRDICFPSEGFDDPDSFSAPLLFFSPFISGGGVAGSGDCISERRGVKYGRLTSGYFVVVVVIVDKLIVSFTLGKNGLYHFIPNN